MSIFAEGTALIEDLSIANSSIVYRVKVGDSKVKEISFIAKYTSAYELLIYSLLGKSLKQIVPKVFGSVSMKNDKCLLILEDLTEVPAYGKDSIKKITSFPKDILPKLIKAVALLHAEFEGKKLQLLNSCVKLISHENLPIHVSKISDLLEACEVLFNTQLKPGTTKEIKEAGIHFSEWSSLMSMENATLVHSDLHQNNFSLNKNNAINIIDWEYAGIHIPQWDLIFFDDKAILCYLECIDHLKSKISSDKLFHSKLKAAKIIRLFHFIAVALKCLFTNQPGSQQFLEALPWFVETLTTNLNKRA